MKALSYGSDVHLYHGLVPDTRAGCTFGHEFTGADTSSREDDGAPDGGRAA